MNFLKIFRLVGILAMFLGGFVLTAVIPAYYFNEISSLRAYLASAVIIEIIGISFVFLGRGVDKGTLLRREAIATVAISWIMVGLLGSIPYLFDNVVTNFFDAYFETISGFTTTGSTILIDIESVSKTSLYWRSITQWLGGMGIIVLFIAIFPQLGVGAKHLFKSEVPGPITEGLKPKIKETSSALWKIYVSLTVFLVFLLWTAGMPVFDSICHSFATLSSGGFSIKNASIKAYDSATIDYIISLFMILAGINFSLYYAFFHGKKKIFFRDLEFKAYLGIIFVSSCIIAYNINELYDGNLVESFRYALFQVAAIITTTGFATDDFNVYPALSKILLVAIMFMGGSAGSTSGGIKVSRILIAIKSSFFEVYKTFRPQFIKTLKIGISSISKDIVKGVFAFIIVFFVILLIGTLYVASFNIDIVTSFTSVLTTLANVGPGLERVGSIENFSFFPSAIKLFLSFCMIMGRLELYTFLVLFIPDFWKK